MLGPGTLTLSSINAAVASNLYHHHQRKRNSHSQYPGSGEVEVFSVPPQHQQQLQLQHPPAVLGTLCSSQYHCSAALHAVCAVQPHCQVGR